MKSSRIDSCGVFPVPTLCVAIKGMNPTATPYEDNTRHSASEVVDFVDRGEAVVSRISGLVRRKKIRGTLFGNSSSLFCKRANISANVLFAHRALSAKWNSQNE